ncbi:DUF1648 domain-containing protein [Micrococcus sp.]|uniref:DUF1648 domain-containing protein n=1 Tax=Micrococcus sp. TaxID=1271 RepID=UPI002A91C447|nr:DUF1648 domain-containing protein [Micrococcus sp.]MDY6054415.1 DUF1648 domain-containing protein [Micrococcus sp.]
MSRTHPAPSTPSPDADPHAAALRAGRGRTWWPMLAAAVLNAVLILLVWRALPTLHEQIPTHWDAAGRPDAWEPTNLGTAAAVPLIGLGMTVVLTGVLALIRRFVAAYGPADPSTWRRFQAEGTARAVTLLLGWICLGTALFGVEATWSVPADGAGTGRWWAMPLLITLVTAVALFGLGPLTAGQHRRMAERARAAGIHPTAEEEAEDARWTATGLLDDPSVPEVLVSKRPGYGMGLTINVGTRVGRVLVVGFVAAVGVLLPAGLWAAALAAR